MYSKTLSMFLLSISIVVLGTIVLINSFSFDSETIKCTLSRILPASLILGILGFLVGKILDASTKKKKI